MLFLLLISSLIHNSNFVQTRKLDNNDICTVMECEEGVMIKCCSDPEIPMCECVDRNPICKCSSELKTSYKNCIHSSFNNQTRYFCCLDNLIATCVWYDLNPICRCDDNRF